MTKRSGAIKKRLPMTAENIIATMSGRKTHTLRVISPQPARLDDVDFSHCKYQVGNMVVLTEMWAVHKDLDSVVGSNLPAGTQIYYFSQGPKPKLAGRTRQARFMPASLGRAKVRVVSIKVMRPQEVDEMLVQREGVGSVKEFMRMWDKINAGREGCSFEDNPLCWAIGYKLVRD